MDDVSQHPALALHDAGYDIMPVIPVGAILSPLTKSLKAHAIGKIPGRHINGGWVGLTEWTTREISRADIEEAVKHGASFGLRTKWFPCIDSDIESPDIARAVQDTLTRLFPSAPLRVGKSPKFALAFRTEVPFREIVLVVRSMENGDERGQIEIKADKRHYVISGLHPSTKRQYEWTDGGRTGGAEILAARAPQSLPLLNAEDVADRVIPELNAALRVHGVYVEQHGRGHVSDVASPAQEHLRAPSIELLRQAVRLIPNDESRERRYWLSMGAAIRAAAGPGNETEGFEIFAAWSEAWEGGWNDPEYVRATFDSLKPPYRIGWGWIEDEARPFGFISDDFVYDDIAPARTEGERIAALSGLPFRAFLLELPDISDGEHLMRWEALRQAADAGDPLRPLFRRVVLPQATKLGKFVDESKRFAVALDAELEQDKQWSRLDAGTKRLLTGAAYAFMVSIAGLASRRNDSPGALVPLEPKTRDDLVADLIPSNALVMLVGPPANGKTYLALELAGRIAKEPALDGITGEPEPERFGDLEVRHGSVLYFASEDATGIADRAARWGKAHGEPQHLRLFSRVPPLTDFERALPFMLEAIGQARTADSPSIRAIFIDVARDAIEGDEDKAEIVSPAMITAGILGRITGAAVVLVHHSPHSDPERPRGSTVFGAAPDFIGAVRKVGDAAFTLAVKKNRHGPAGDTFSFHLREGVLHRGEARSKVAVKSSEEYAIIAAHVTRSLPNAQDSVARPSIAAAMSEARPDLFGEGVKYSTAQTRITRGLDIAVSRDWLIAQPRLKSFAVGPEAPPPLLLPGRQFEGSLEDAA